MLYGWVGKILWVDLTNGRITTEDTTEYVPKFIGGQGLNAKIFWDLGCPKVSAFDPANPLIISTGPLTGTIAPGTGRAEICSISPFTHPKELYTYSSFGGTWPGAFKYTGHDAMVILGKADEPVYLSIHDDDVEIKDASDLWGLDTFEMQKVLSELEPGASVACIGPAGENLSRTAIILTETSHASGGAGFGAVMGSKNLKAIAVKGTGRINVARPDELLELVRYIDEEVGYGTFGMLASKGDGLIYFEAGKRTGDKLKKYWKKANGCFGCPICCEAVIDIPGVGRGAAMCSDWAYAECGSRGPGELGDTSYYLGEDKPTAPAVTEKPAWEAAILSQKFGINNFDILWGLTGWLWHCYKRGILTEEDTGLPTPEWLGGTAKDHEFLTALFYGIAYKKSPFADGVTRAAEHFGKESWDVLKELYGARGYVSHWMDAVPGVLHWMFETRDPFDSCHDYFQIIRRPEISKYAFGTEKPAHSSLKDPTKTVYEDSEIAVIITQHRQRIKNSLPVCDYAFPVLYSKKRDGVGDTSLESRLYSAITGIGLTEKELLSVGEMIYNLERAIQVKRENRTREDDAVYDYKFKHRYWGEESWHLGDHWYGPIDKEKFEALKDKYYERRDWDKETGRPTRAKLEELGLKDVADELEKLGLLPQ
jgi:aldehyde:ferredoxin oxidoreductase